MNNIVSKGHFTYAVIQGLGSNFNYKVRQEFASMVYNIAGERPVDAKNLLMNYYEPQKQTWMSFVNDTKSNFKLEEMKSADTPPIVRTAPIQRDISMIKGWLDNGNSFILVGPEGCGKSLVIKNLINQMKSTQVAMIHCNAQTSAF